MDKQRGFLDPSREQSFNGRAMRSLKYHHCDHRQRTRGSLKEMEPDSGPVNQGAVGKVSKTCKWNVSDAQMSCHLPLRLCPWFALFFPDQKLLSTLFIANPSMILTQVYLTVAFQKDSRQMINLGAYEDIRVDVHSLSVVSTCCCRVLASLNISYFCPYPKSSSS